MTAQHRQNEPMTTPEIDPPVKVQVLAGAVRLTADLYAEESVHQCLVRDLTVTAVRRLAIKLLQAAEDAEEEAAQLG